MTEINEKIIHSMLENNYKIRAEYCEKLNSDIFNSAFEFYIAGLRKLRIEIQLLESLLGKK